MDGDDDGVDTFAGSATDGDVVSDDTDDLDDADGNDDNPADAACEVDDDAFTDTVADENGIPFIVVVVIDDEGDTKPL